ncbi:MAG: UDP-glucose 4-epimerase GalE [Oscillospiraceae bacterium]|nr:UDP-glucose 4-epimerase GalE [Oscillospiraceae bacterium]
MTIFVTGGAGYIGSHVIVELLAQGYDVVAADNFSNSKQEAVWRTRQVSGADFPFYEMDICDVDGVATILTAHEIDCVIHLAGLKAVGESVSKPLEYYSNNIVSTISLLTAMEECAVRKLIFSSSATVYSGDNEMPLSEESRTGNCTNPYGWTKFMCEQIMTDFSKAHKDFSVVLLRYFNPIGAHSSGMIGEDPQDIPNNLMPYIAQTAVGQLPSLSIFGDDYDTPDGTGVRDYIHVSDLATGHAAAVDYLDTQSGVSIFNLGTGKGASVLELVTAFEKAAGLKIPKKIVARRPGDLAVCYASTEKAKRELGWEAKKTIEDACADTWRWQQNKQRDSTHV